ncbi:hypothetical protein [Streptomyces virginiae]|uniref:hypothetical protein n=1 Tax=Streptomyces virginiae TaxID=1961 RepID=UPI00341B4DB7
MRGYIRGAVVLLALSSAAVGCSGGETGGRGGAPLTSAELADAVLSGKHSGYEASPQSEPLLEDVDVITASEPACQPVADLRSVTPKRAATGTAWAALQVGDTSAGASVVLTSYPEGEAKASMNELKAAVATCKGFTLSSRRGWSERNTLEALPPVGIGDESISFSVVSPQGPSKGQTMTIVRTGGSRAVYLTGTEGDPIPAALMKRQHEQLQKAG